MACRGNVLRPRSPDTQQSTRRWRIPAALIVVAVSIGSVVLAQPGPSDPDVEAEVEVEADGDGEGEGEGSGTPSDVDEGSSDAPGSGELPTPEPNEPDANLPSDADADSDAAPEPEATDGADAPPPQRSVAESLGARWRATVEPARQLATHVRGTASALAEPAFDPVVEALGDPATTVVELAEILGIPSATLSDRAALDGHVETAEDAVHVAEQAAEDARAGARLLTEQANRRFAEQRPVRSRLDVAWAGEELSRRAARIAARDAWHVVAERERDLRRARATLARLEARRDTVAAAATVDEGDTMGVNNAAEIQQEISQERARLDAETRRTDEIQAEADAARLEAERARAAARNERERMVATEQESLSRSLDRIAAERRDVEALQAELTEEKEAFVAQQQDFDQRLQAVMVADEAGAGASRRALADTLFTTVHERRVQTRARALEAREHRAAYIDEVRDAERAVADATAALEIVGADGVLTPGDPVYEALRTVRARQVETAQLDLDLVTWRQDLVVERWRLTRQQVYFFARLSDRLVPAISRSKRTEIFALNRENLADEPANIRDRLIGLQLLTADRIERLDEFTTWLSSLAGITSLARTLFGLALLVLAVRFVQRQRLAWLERALKRIERFRWARRHNLGVLKAIEVLRDSLGWWAILGAVEAAFLLVPTDLPEVDLLRQLIRKALWLMLALVTSRTLLLPAAERGATTADARELQAFGVDLLRLSPRAARLLVLTIRVWLAYAVTASVLSDMLHFVLGESFTTIQADRLMTIGQLLLVYVLVWSWRDVIVSSSIRIAKLEGTRPAQLLEQHKNRIYSVIALGFLAVWVVGVEVARFTRTRVANLSLARQVRNFVFRKRVERAQAAQTEAGASGTLDPDQLPTAYQSWFRGTPPGELEPVLLKRPTEDTLMEEFEAWWTTDSACAIALVGEFGMGKSTQLDQFERAVGDKVPVHRVRFTDRVTDPGAMISYLTDAVDIGERGDVRTETALIERLNDNGPGVILIDDAHFAFLRTIGGFHALDDLLRVVSLTNDRWMWVVTFDRYAWQFLNRVRDRRHNFRRVVHMPQMSDHEVQNLIERRNSAAGMDVSYANLLTDDADDGNIFEVIRTAAGYFRLLSEYAEGNPRVAMHFWLRSLMSSNDGLSEVRLFERPDPKSCASWSTAQVFALAALAQHAELHIRELCAVIAAERDEVETEIERLRDRGVVRRTPDGRVRIATRWLRVVLSDLRNRNVLYVS